LRRLVYELARAKLERQMSQFAPPLTPSEIMGYTRALEAAIAQVESKVSPGQLAETWLRQIYGPAAAGGSGTIPSASSDERLVELSNPAPVQSRDPSAAESEPNILTDRPNAPLIVVEHKHAPRRTSQRVWFWFLVWPMIQLVCGPVLGLAFNAATTVGRDYAEPVVAVPIDKAQQPAQPTGDAALPETLAASAPALPQIPLPAVYGMYAISDGQLHELHSLPIRIPDPRIMLSAEISSPSRTLLPDGKAAFVLYRRELVRNAPEKMSIRVVARVAREMKFAGGKVTTTDTHGSWRIRSNSFVLRVAPIGTTGEMIVARLEDDLSLPAGRYALVYNGQGYDFTVDGTVAEAAHCLERVEASNGIVYAECRSH
jgi:hypothetical protein